MRALLDETSSAPTRGSLPPPPGPVAGAVQRSQWHSPVPYLFGGLAVLLGLISFALLILACSYWSVSANPSEVREEEDIEKGAAERGKEVARVYEEKILVIMAGDKKPTYLATPVRSSWGGCNRDKSADREASKVPDSSEKVNKDCDNGGADSADQHVATAVALPEDRIAPLPAAAMSRVLDDQ